MKKTSYIENKNYFSSNQALNFVCHPTDQLPTMVTPSMLMLSVVKRKTEHHDHPALLAI